MASILHKPGLVETVASSEQAAPRTPLHVAVVIDSFVQPAWVARVVDTILGCDYATISRVILITAPDRRNRRRRSVAHALYEWADARLFRTAGDASEPLDLSPKLAGIPVLRQADAASNLDDIAVILQFTPGAAPPGFAARYGTWSLRFSGGLSEFTRQQEITTAVIEADGRVIAQTAVGTDTVSLRRGRNRLQWKSASMMGAALARLHKEGSLPGGDAAPPLSAAPVSSARMAETILAAGWRYILHQLRRKMMRQQWLVAFRFRKDAADPNDHYREFHRLLPPADRLWADPFVVADAPDHAWVFVEELAYAERRGVISVMEIRRDGTHSAPRRVLEKPYHLSYPCVFRWAGSYYMLPETGENNTIELYRCISFPYEWEPLAVVMKDIRAVDATMFEDAGRWWMFLSTAPDGEVFDELHLFHSSSPLGPWLPHPQNPVVSDITAGRCAGRPFRRDGRLFRAAQNGSRRYGRSMKLRELMQLTTSAFVEQDVGRIEPEWMRGLFGTHTLNVDGDVTVIDGVRYRWGRR